MELSLSEIHQLNDIAQMANAYSNAIANMKILSNPEYDAMPESFKATFENYNEYRTITLANHSNNKQAIKVKLLERQTQLDTSFPSVTYADILKWKNELSIIIALTNGK